MIYNGTIPTTLGALFTVPNRKQAEVNLQRVVNNSGVAITFTLYLNANGTDVPITPINTQLPIGAAYDDIPTIVLGPGTILKGVSDTANVGWTINAIVTNAVP